MGTVSLRLLDLRDFTEVQGQYRGIINRGSWKYQHPIPKLSDSSVCLYLKGRRVAPHGHFPFIATLHWVAASCALPPDKSWSAACDILPPSC